MWADLLILSFLLFRAVAHCAAWLCEHWTGPRMARLHRYQRKRADRRPCQSMSASQTCAATSWTQSEGKHPITRRDVHQKQHNNSDLWLPGWHDYGWNRLHRPPRDDQERCLPVPSPIRGFPQVGLYICEQRGLPRHSWQVNGKDIYSYMLYF